MNTIPESYLNNDINQRLPNLANILFKAIEDESLILLLDAKGYQASTSSACSSNKLEASPVLTALDLDLVVVHDSLRLYLAPEIYFIIINRVSSIFFLSFISIIYIKD